MTDRMLSIVYEMIYYREIMTCSHTSPSTVQQSMDEVEFERGIWAAARDGEEVRLMELLRKGWDPSSMDSSGYTALHYAARAGHKDVVQVHDINCSVEKRL